MNCPQCGKLLEPNTPEEEELQRQEAVEIFGKPPEEWDGGFAVICDDCFQAMHPLKFAHITEAMKRAFMKHGSTKMSQQLLTRKANEILSRPPGEMATNSLDIKNIIDRFIESSKSWFGGNEQLTVRTLYYALRERDMELNR